MASERKCRRGQLLGHVVGARSRAAVDRATLHGCSVRCDMFLRLWTWVGERCADTEGMRVPEIPVRTRLDHACGRHMFRGGLEITGFLKALFSRLFGRLLCAFENIYRVIT